jgi:hypothetical protein
MISADAEAFIKIMLADIPGVDAEAVLGTIQEKFGSYDEQRLADAVERTVSADGTTADNVMDRIIAGIERTTAQAMDRVFLGSGGRVKGEDMDAVRMAWDRVRKGNWVTPISNKVRAFARRAFPDISDELIRKNYCILSYYATPGRGRLDEKTHVQLRMDKMTGCIIEYAVQR